VLIFYYTTIGTFEIGYALSYYFVVVGYFLIGSIFFYSIVAGD
jgi:hypothetical protein